jgi:hypothetical protein
VATLICTWGDSLPYKIDIRFVNVCLGSFLSGATRGFPLVKKENLIKIRLLCSGCPPHSEQSALLRVAV